MYDGGGAGRDLTLERPGEEIVTKVQRPRSPPFRLPALPPARPSTRPPGLQTAHPATITRHFRVGTCTTTRTDHRSHRSAYPPATRLPGLQTAHPPTITRLATSESETETLSMCS